MKVLILFFTVSLINHMALANGVVSRELINQPIACTENEPNDSIDISIGDEVVFQGRGYFDNLQKCENMLHIFRSNRVFNFHPDDNSLSVLKSYNEVGPIEYTPNFNQSLSCQTNIFRGNVRLYIGEAQMFIEDTFHFMPLVPNIDTNNASAECDNLVYLSEAKGSLLIDHLARDFRTQIVLNQGPVTYEINSQNRISCGGYFKTYISINDRPVYHAMNLYQKGDDFCERIVSKAQENHSITIDHSIERSWRILELN